jgi:periplasmic protein TonB
MKMTATFSSLVIAAAIAVGCNAPPSEEVNDAAKPTAGETAPAAADDAAAKKTPKAAARRAKTAVAKANTPKADAPVARVALTPPAKIKNVQPVYPALARAAGVEGSVLLSVAVDADGKVSDARVLRSVPLLDQAALDAVKQWEYTPMRRGTVAVPAVMTVTVNFVRS